MREFLHNATIAHFRKSASRTKAWALHAFLCTHVAYNLMITHVLICINLARHTHMRTANQLPERQRMGFVYIHSCGTGMCESSHAAKHARTHTRRSG